jgi:hypothetical protein
MNRRLWKDEVLFQSFYGAVLLLNKSVADQNWNPITFLDCANILDDVMQKYERQYGPVEDPIFYWSFATANALFLLIGKKYDELGPVRVQYVLNGYKEGLEWHLLHPSFPRIYIDKAFEHMSPFAEAEDEKWMAENRGRYAPIPESTNTH